MILRRHLFGLIGFTLVTIAVIAVAQPPWWGGGGGGGRRQYSNELPSDRVGVPDWDVDEAFKSDVFTFVRVQYDSFGGGRRHGGGWRTDWPDSDLNFSYRLQQLTSLKVNPDPISLRLTDEKLFDYPSIYTSRGHE